MAGKSSSHLQVLQQQKGIQATSRAFHWNWTLLRFPWSPLRGNGDGLFQARVESLSGFRGAPATVALIKRYAIEAQRDPAVRMFAEEVVQGLTSKDYVSEILAIYFAVLASTRYANDPRSVELVKKPGLVVRQIRAGARPSLDCDDLVALEAALLLSLGREVRAMTVAFSDQFYDGERQYSHVILAAREPRANAWITLDPVAAEETGTMLRRVRAIKIWPIA